MMDLAARIEEVLDEPSTRKLLRIFFDPDETFAGKTFDDLGCNPPGHFTASDLVAVSLLDMRFRPKAVRALLSGHAGSLSELLSAVAHDVDLWAATDENLAAAEALWRSLRSGGPLKGIGRTTTSKLLARKRPRLVPIVDSVIRGAMDLEGKDTWREMRTALQQPGLPQKIESLRPEGVGSPISTLRLLDAAIWMRHSNGLPAKAARRRAAD